MRIAFITSAYRTIFARGMSPYLERAGHEVYYISPNKRWAHWLVNDGVPTERIFDVTRFARQWRDETEPDERDLSDLATLERANGWQINDLILMDPLLRRRSAPYARRYLAVCQREVQTWLRKQAIDVVSGELTWAFELIVGQRCRADGIPFLRPIFPRIPDGMMCFVTGHREEGMIRLRDTSQDDQHKARAIVASFRERPREPAYMAAYKVPVFHLRPQRLRTLVSHVWNLAGDPYDETSRRPLGLLANHAAKPLRERYNHWFGRFHSPTLPPARPFVYVTLHMQPEASIDVFASALSNQLETIRALARTLPVTHDLYVKEHRVALSVRPPSVLRALGRIPGVKLIDPYANSFALTQHADLVISPTGTSSYEAALLGKPAATMAPTVFDRMLITNDFNPYADSLARLLDPLQLARPLNEEMLVERLADLLAHCVPGMFGDAFWEPQMQAPDHLARTAAGFDVAMQHVSKPKRAEA